MITALYTSNHCCPTKSLSLREKECITYTAGVENHAPNQSTKPETMLNEHVADYPLQANGTAVTSNILSLHFSQCNESRI